jgi:hypothetical protein
METEKINELTLKIEGILDANLPKEAYKLVAFRKGYFGGNYLLILIAASNYQINNVSGQLPQLVSLSLDLESLELSISNAGGMGGRSIYTIPNKDIKPECYLAMKSLKLAFRTPKPELKPVLNTIEKFAQNWVKALKENRNTLMYQNYVDYDKLLS